MNPQKDIVNENQRRAIGTTLALLDETLCEIEEWARGREVCSVLHKVRNLLSHRQRALLLQEISYMRSVITELADALQLASQVRSAADDIWGKCAVLREHLMELQGGRFKGYGTVRQELVHLLNEKVPLLLATVDKMASSIAPTRAVRDKK